MKMMKFEIQCIWANTVVRVVGPSPDDFISFQMVEYQMTWIMRTVPTWVNKCITIKKRQMAFQAWKILKFCHFVIEKSGESSSKNFSVIYSFEARITTNASVHHFLSFPRFLNIDVLDHTLCWFIFFYRCPKGCSHQCCLSISVIPVTLITQPVYQRNPL